MLKVLEVCTDSSPAYALVFARAHTLNQQLAPKLQIDLLCSAGTEVDLMRAQGMQVMVTDLHRSLNPWQLLQSTRNLHRVLRDNSYDVVHLHFGVPSLVGRLLGLFMRQPVWIYQSHGYSIAENTGKLGKWTYLLIERALKHTVNLALFQSHEDMRMARQYKLLHEEQMIYLGNGIDTERFIPAAKADLAIDVDPAALAKRPLVFGMVARFETIKNHRLLIDAIKYLRLLDKNFKVRLIGQGQLQANIQAQISAHQLQAWVEILPYSHDMPAFYQQIDVGVLTSFGEGLPRALLEPMACEKPVVCTDVKGSREALIDGKHGFILPLGEPQQLAEKMLWLMQHPEEREQMGKAARQQVLTHFSEQQVVERLGEVYQVCLEQAQQVQPASLEASQ